MPTTEQSYEVHALRYFTRSATKSHEIFRFDLYGDEDEEIGMDYSFWLLRNEARTVLVDCGFNKERAAAKNRFQHTDPVELLVRMGVTPDQVEHVIITHMHYDHVGNVELFPNAVFSMAREELDYFTGPYGDRELERKLVDPEEVRLVKLLVADDRLVLVDGTAEPFPGIRLTKVGGHTAGQLIVEVDTNAGTIVLASDAMHYFEEIERDRPYNLFNNLGDMYRGYDILRELAARPGVTVIPGHDPRVATMYELVQPECFDLTAPVTNK